MEVHILTITNVGEGIVVVASFGPPRLGVIREMTTGLVPTDNICRRLTVH